MTKNLKTIPPTQKLDKVKKLFKANTFRHLPVVESKKLIGIISHTDFRKIMLGIDLAFENDTRKKDEILSKIEVREAMTPHPYTVEPTTTVRRVMDIFKQELFHAIPVVEDGKLVGIVSQHDVFYYLF